MPESKKSPLQFSLALALSGKGAIPEPDYKKALASAHGALDWLRGHARLDRLVLLGDPGRNYFSAQGLEELARYKIPTSLQLENRGMRETVVWRVLPHP